MPSSTVGRLTPDDEHPADRAAEAREQPSTTAGLMLCASSAGVDRRRLAGSRSARSGSITATVPGGSPIGMASTSTSAS